MPAPNVSAFPLDDELVLCAELTGNVFILNRTGAQIWALLDGSRTRREVAVAIGETYGIEFQDALADVDELVGDLTSAGLVCRVWLGIDVQTNLQRTTCEITFLDFRARLNAPPAILRFLRPILPIAPDWVVKPNSPVGTSVEVTYGAPTWGGYTVSRDGATVWSGRRSAVVPYVEWAVTSAAIENLNAYYLLHAGVVARGNSGVLLPAASGSGKSSLVAKLVAEGWTYLSDEVAVIDPQSGQLLPFAKSLHLHQGAIEALGSRYPILASSESYQALDDDETWYLPPQPEWLPLAPVPLRYVIIPRFAPDAEVDAIPASPSTILAGLLEQSFNLRQHGSRAIGDLVRLLRGVPGYTLTFNDLDRAAKLVDEVVPAD